MVKLSRRPVSSLGRTLAWTSLWLLPGCALTSKTQLDQCHQQSQALHAENAKLRDQVLSLRAQNRDMAQRSVDDERLLKRQEEAIQRLDRSVVGYQEDRDQMASAFARLKERIESSAGPQTSTLRESLRRFALAHPGCSFDADAGSLTLASERLFAPGTSQVQDAGAQTLKDLAALLAPANGQKGQIVVVSHEEDPSVVRAGGASEHQEARLQYLIMARAVQVRERLAKGAGIDPTRIRVSDEAGGLANREDVSPSPSSGTVMEIHLRRSTPEKGRTGP